MNSLEVKYSDIQESVDSYIAQVMDIRDRLDNKKQSYSEAVSSQEHKPKTATPIVREPAEASAVTSVSNAQDDASRGVNHVTSEARMDNRDEDTHRERLTSESTRIEGNFRGRGRGQPGAMLRGSIRGGSVRDGSFRGGSTRGGLTAPSLWRGDSLLSLDSRTSHASDTWEKPPYMMRRERQREKRRRKIVTGSMRDKVAFQGAPEPGRQIFIYRVMGGTTAECLMQYMRDKGVQVREVDQVAHKDAKFMSFKATVTTSDYDKVFDSQLWSAGIRIRDYVRPKRGFSSNGW